MFAIQSVNIYPPNVMSMQKLEIRVGLLILIFYLEVKGYQWADWTKAPSVLSPGHFDAFQAFG